MKTTPYPNFKRNLKSFMDEVSHDKESLFVTMTEGEDIVVMSKSDYDSMHETIYLLGNPKNGVRIYEALAELNEGKGVSKDLIDE